MKKRSYQPPAFHGLDSLNEAFAELHERERRERLRNQPSCCDGDNSTHNPHPPVNDDPEAA